MSIDYEKINEGNGWTTQTSLGPTNLNHMESGIKSACDAIDTDCVQATDITPISAYELVSADVATKAINDGNGVNIASQFASITSDLNVLTKMKVLESGIKNYAYTLQVDCPSFGLLFCWYDSNYFLGYVGEFDGYKIMPLVKNADLATIDSSTRKITLPIAYTRFALVKIQQ